MSSIATKRGDAGQTSLIGGARVLKSDQRVEAYGTLDELGAQIAFARSICEDVEINNLAKEVQKELFTVNSVIATVPDGKRTPPEVTNEMIERLTDEVNRIEALPGIVGDWSLPGDHAAGAAFDVARTICRRGERILVRLMERDDRPQLTNVVTYVNRLSDLLWLMGRILEIRSGVDSRLRDETHVEGNKWSKAW